MFRLVCAPPSPPLPPPTFSTPPPTSPPYPPPYLQGRGGRLRAIYARPHPRRQRCCWAQQSGAGFNCRWCGSDKSMREPFPPPPLWLFEAPVRKIILQMHTPARTGQCWRRQTPLWTWSVPLDAPGQRHGQQPRLWDGRPPE